MQREPFYGKERHSIEIISKVSERSARGRLIEFRLFPTKART